MRHMQEQARLGSSHGIPEAVVQQNGDIVRLAPGRPERLAQVEAGRLVLDGDLIVPADGEAVTMRRRLSRDGMMVVALDHKLRPTIETIGLPLDEDHDEFIAEAKADILAALSKLRGPARKSVPDIKEAARLAARRAAQRWSGKKPQVRVMLTGN
jgi:ribonuclease J